jgi:hypothetical protein
LFLEYSHIDTEENNVVQKNMVGYLVKDMGESTTSQLKMKLAKSITWARNQREEIRIQKKANAMRQAMPKSSALTNPSSSRSGSRSGGGSGGGVGKGTDQHLMSGVIAALDAVDPGGSKHIMRLFDLLCSGQFRDAQLFMSNQESHKEPVDFLIDSYKYIEEMAKDFRSRSVELTQAYGSLKSFLTGPCKPNQLHMAMETECVLVVNRVLRELYKDADKNYRKREEKCVNYSDVEEICLKWSALGKEVSFEQILNMIIFDDTND